MIFERKSPGTRILTHKFFNPNLNPTLNFTLNFPKPNFGQGSAESLLIPSIHRYTTSLFLRFRATQHFEILMDLRFKIFLGLAYP